MPCKFLKIENTLENERAEEMSSTSLQHLCEIVESTSENQDFQDYISLEHNNLEPNLSIRTLSALKKLVLFTLDLRTMIS